MNIFRYTGLGLAGVSATLYVAGPACAFPGDVPEAPPLTSMLNLTSTASDGTVVACNTVLDEPVSVPPIHRPGTIESST